MAYGALIYVLKPHSPGSNRGSVGSMLSYNVHSYRSKWGVRSLQSAFFIAELKGFSYLELLRPVVSLSIHYLTIRDGRDRSDTMIRLSRHQRKPTRQLKNDVCS